MNAQAADAEDAKARLRKATVGENVGPDMSAFLRQLVRSWGAWSLRCAGAAADHAPLQGHGAKAAQPTKAADEFEPEQWVPGRK